MFSFSPATLGGLLLCQLLFLLLELSGGVQVCLRVNALMSLWLGNALGCGKKGNETNSLSDQRFCPAAHTHSTPLAKWHMN